MPALDFMGDKWLFLVGKGISLYAKRRIGRSLACLPCKRAGSPISRWKSLPPAGRWNPVSDDGHWLLFPQKDERSSELMLIEHWR